MRLALAIATFAVLATATTACHRGGSQDQQQLDQNRDRTAETMLQAAAKREQAAGGDAGPDGP